MTASPCCWGGIFLVGLKQEDTTACWTKATVRLPTAQCTADKVDRPIGRKVRVHVALDDRVLHPRVSLMELGLARARDAVPFASKLEGLVMRASNAATVSSSCSMVFRC